MAIKLFLKIFFSLPVWLLRCLTFQKSIIINNQILDFQTQVFLALQSLQSNVFDDPNRFNSAQELRTGVRKWERWLAAKRKAKVIHSNNRSFNS